MAFASQILSINVPESVAFYLWSGGDKQDEEKGGVRQTDSINSCFSGVSPAERRGQAGRGRRWCSPDGFGPPGQNVSNSHAHPETKVHCMFNAYSVYTVQYLPVTILVRTKDTLIFLQSHLNQLLSIKNTHYSIMIL